MPRIVYISAGTAAGINHHVDGPSARQLPAPPYATLAVEILAGDVRPSTSSAAGACTSSLANSPAPPASDGRAEELPTGKEGAGQEPILRKGRAGSAQNSWITGLATAKFLIVEKTCLTSGGGFSTSHVAFSTSRGFSILHRPYTSLSLKLLKKKEKTEKKEAWQRTNQHPRVRVFFPRIRATAYFLIHEFHPLPRVDWWKFAGIFFFKFINLSSENGPSTSPRVALRVVTPFALKAGEQCS